LYLGSTRDRYCNWQFMEYLKDRYCYSAVNAIWNGAPTADPFLGVMQAMKWELSQLNNFLGEWAMHNITWDYRDPGDKATAKHQGALYRSKYAAITDTSKTERRLRLTQLEPLAEDFATTRRFASPADWAPQRFGYNVIQLVPEAGAKNVTVTFRGVAGTSADADWRWGLVATDNSITTARYSAVQQGAEGKLTFCMGEGERLWLVVMATPSKFQSIVWDQPYNKIPRYPYLLQLEGAWPENFNGGKPKACPTGLEPAAQGGGCAPPGTKAYVGPYAWVLSGGTAAAGARIEDHATVVSGSVAAGTVGALTLLGTASGNSRSSFTMTGGAAKTTFYPLGFFEANQGLTGGSLIGDVEYRGAELNLTSGKCSGFVDEATCTEAGADTTPRPPYSWPAPKP
jgi:hypothetical protein